MFRQVRVIRILCKRSKISITQETASWQEQKKQTSRVDELLDDLLADHQGPEAILGESGLLKQLSKRLVERALAGELSHHLQAEAVANGEADPLNSAPSNSRNGHSKKDRTVPTR